MKNVLTYKNKKKKVKIYFNKSMSIYIRNYLEKTVKGKRQKTACGCSFLQHDRVECLSNDILVGLNFFSNSQ